MWPIGLYAATLIAMLIVVTVLKRRSFYRDGVVLPPGSKGLPFIGETLQLFIPSYTLDLPPFIKTRIQRYGAVFQTHLVGRPVVVSADHDFNRYLVQQEGKTVELWYLDTYSHLLAFDGDGRTNALGYVHKYIRNITMSQFGSDKLRNQLLSQVENMVHKTLQDWSMKESVDVKEETLTFFQEFAAKQLFGYDYNKTKIKLGDKFSHMLRGLFSFPLYIPAEVTAIMKDAIKERQASPEETYRGDFLDQAIKDLHTEKFLTEDFIMNVMFGLMFALSESTSMTLTLVIKFLEENPRVMDELLVEHEKILNNKEDPSSPLTYSEVKSMTFTHQVLDESQRLGNISPGLLRRALKDIEYKGYTIPSGWTILMLTSVCHYNPNIYKDPLSFNPHRWKELEPGAIKKNFMPFGGGVRQCAGADFAKTLVPTFIHVLVTKYRLKKISGGDISRSPILVFLNGLHIEIVRK